MKKALGVISAVSVVYFFCWLKLGLPYSFFSVEDQLILDGKAFAHYPAYVAWIRLVEIFSIPFGLQSNSVLLLQGLLANTFTLAVLGWLSFRVTKRYSMMLAIMVLFSLSTWPAAYLFKSSQAPMSAALTLGVLVCVIEAYLNKDIAPQLLAVGGTLAGFQLMTSVLLLPMVFFQMVVIFLLFASWKHSDRWRALGFHMIPLLIIATLYVAMKGPLLFEHIKISWDASQFSGALSRQGHVPGLPFASFYFMGNYYAPGIFYFAALSSFIYMLFFLDLKRRRTTQEKVLFLFAGLVVIHPFVVDLSPMAVVARAHYPIYPLILLTAGCFTLFWVEKLPAKRKPILMGVAILVGWSTYLNLVHNVDLINVKQSGARYAQKLKDKKLYAFKGDHHVALLEKWLDVPLTRVESFDEIPRALAHGLVIGPHGRGSGHSLFLNAALRDFELQVKKPREMKDTRLPYYGYFPAFIFEEPTSAALYFAGQMPHFDAPNLQVKLWTWDGSQGS